MRTVILVPWRTDHGPRATIYTHVREQLETIGLPIYEGDTTEHPFNINGAWNTAADRPWDVALFWGADFTLEDPVTALNACVEAAKGHPYVFAFDRATKLTMRETARVHAGRRPPARDDKLPFGGVRAVNRAWWNLVGGYDERFKGWGHGDRAFVHQLRRHGGEPSRVPGRLIMHRHPGRAHLTGDPYYSFQETNLQLLEEYRAED